MAKKRKFENLQCHVCHVTTEHELVCIRSKTLTYPRSGDFDGEESGYTEIEFQVFQCCGCKELVIRRISTDSEEGEASYKFYPPRNESRVVHTPVWAHQLPSGMYALMREVYAALGTRSFRLAAMGLRALLEEVMNSKLGDIGGFDQKMEAMVKGGLLSEFQKEVLDPTLELGHAAIHRGHQPSGQQIQAALVVVESLLNLMFVQSKAIESIKEGVEPRQRKVKAAIQDKNAPP